MCEVLNLKRLTIGDIKRNIPKDTQKRKHDRSGYAFTEKYLGLRKDIPAGKIQEVYVKLELMGLRSDQHILESRSGREGLINFE